MTINGEPAPVPDAGRLVHLQFRRYAGCPVCNLHLRSFAARHDELVVAGIREVVVFHSRAETMREFQGQRLAGLGQPDRRRGRGAHRDREPARERNVRGGCVLVRSARALGVTALGTVACALPVLRVPRPGVPAGGGTGACGRGCR
jgi:hypothetical protein